VEAEVEGDASPDESDGDAKPANKTGKRGRPLSKKASQKAPASKKGNFPVHPDFLDNVLDFFFTCLLYILVKTSSKTESLKNSENKTKKPRGRPKKA
jgi:hypothetical protein